MISKHLKTATPALVLLMAISTGANIRPVRWEIERVILLGGPYPRSRSIAVSDTEESSP